MNLQSAKQIVSVRSSHSDFYFKLKGLNDKIAKYNRIVYGLQDEDLGEGSISGSSPGGGMYGFNKMKNV